MLKTEEKYTKLKIPRVSLRKISLENSKNYLSLLCFWREKKTHKENQEFHSQINFQLIRNVFNGKRMFVTQN